MRRCERKRYFQHSEMRFQRATRYSVGLAIRHAGRSCAQALSTLLNESAILRRPNRLKARKQTSRAGRPAAQSGPGFAIATNRISFITSVFCFPPDNRHSIFAVSLLRLVSSPSSLPSCGPALTAILMARGGAQLGTLLVVPRILDLTTRVSCRLPCQKPASFPQDVLQSPVNSRDCGKCDLRANDTSLIKRFNRRKKVCACDFLPNDFFPFQSRAND